MEKTTLKKKNGEVISLDGSHVVVSDSSGADALLDSELETIRGGLHEHENDSVLAGLSVGEDGKLEYDGKPISENLVDCVVITAGDPVPANLRENGIVFEIQAE